MHSRASKQELAPPSLYKVPTPSFGLYTKFGTDPNKKVYVHIDQWRSRPLSGSYPYVYLDGIYLKRNWGGEYENVSVLVALAVNEDGCREVIGASEGMKEDKGSWLSFLRSLKARSLQGVWG